MSSHDGEQRDGLRSLLEAIMSKWIYKEMEESRGDTKKEKEDEEEREKETEQRGGEVRWGEGDTTGEQRRSEAK